MKKELNKLSSSVSSSLNESNSNNAKQGQKIGRPHLTQREKMKSNAVTLLTKLEDAQNIFISKNNVQMKSETQAEETRTKNSWQQTIAKNIRKKEQQRKSISDKKILDELNDEISRLTSFLSKKQHQIHYDDAVRPLGKPQTPDALVMVRYEDDFIIAHQNLNQQEAIDGVTLTSKGELKALVVERRNQKIGRNKNSEVQGIDKEIRKCQKAIKNMNHRLKCQNILNEPNLGRKKHGQEKLVELNDLLDFLTKKVKLLESKMSSKELLKRQISQLKNKRNEIDQKEKYEKHGREKQRLKNELLTIDKAIVIKQQKLQQLQQKQKRNKSKKQIIKSDVNNHLNNVSKMISENEQSDHDFNLIINRLKNSLVENISLKSDLLKIIFAMETAFIKV